MTLRLSITAIFATTLLSCTLMAQTVAETPTAAITAHEQEMRGLSIKSIEEKTAAWVATIPAEALMEYAQAAERLLYTPQNDSTGRAIYRTLVCSLLKQGGDNPALLRYQYQYDILCRNNEGDTATNITYTTIDGETHDLASSRAPHTLLIFNDPECDECAHLRQALLADKTVTEAIDNGTLAVLAIYPDEPTDEWREQMAHYPLAWIKGYAEDASDLYDLRQLPSTYLLDAQHTILLRNASPEAIIQAIRGE